MVHCLDYLSIYSIYQNYKGQKGPSNEEEQAKAEQWEFGFIATPWLLQCLFILLNLVKLSTVKLGKNKMLMG